MRTPSIRNKILLMTVGVIALLGIAVIVFIKISLTKALLTDLQEKGISFTKYLADASINNALTENKLRLQIHINDYKSATKEIEYIFIHDRKNRVLAHTFGKRFPSDLIKANLINRGEEYSTQSLIINGINILDIAVPMLKGEAGFVHIGFSDKYLGILVDRKVKFLIVIIIIFSVIGIILAGFLTSAITKPIYNLTATAKQVSKGYLDQKAAITTRDEIGQLGITFNEMIDTLIIDRSKIQEYTENLEGMIRQVSVAKEELDQINKKLQITNKELVKSNEELDEFTYVVSHDLKEPLRGIGAFSGFLRQKYWDKLDEKGKHYIEIILDSSVRMRRLIDDLLKLSRIRFREIPFENTNFSYILHEVKDNLSYALESNKCVLIIPDVLPMVYCDSTRMREVFHNLIANSIKYNDKDEPQIEIGYNEDDNYYTFYVKDNGKGIEEQYFDKIFHIFQRLERDDNEGTGAGLTIVKKIMHQHGGRVWVESKVGEGTIIFFTIPKKHSQ